MDTSALRSRLKSAHSLAMFDRLLAIHSRQMAALLPPQSLDSLQQQSQSQLHYYSTTKRKLQKALASTKKQKQLLEQRAQVKAMMSHNREKQHLEIEQDIEQAMEVIMLRLAQQQQQMTKLTQENERMVKEK